MAYTPDAADAAQPTGNQALSSAALEFRTLKQYIQTTKTAQAVRDTAQDVATTLVASNLAAALVTQDTRDDGQDSAITAAGALGTAAAVLAGTKTTRVVLTGSGNWTVPAGVTSVLVIAQGGSTCEANYGRGGFGAADFSFYSIPQAGEVQVRQVGTTPAATIAYSCGAGQQLQHAMGAFGHGFVSETVTAAATTFGSVTALPAKSFTAQSATGTVVTKENSVYGTATTYDGHYPSTEVSLSSADTASMTAGLAGIITLLY